MGGVTVLELGIYFADQPDARCGTNDGPVQREQQAVGLSHLNSPASPHLEKSTTGRDEIMRRNEGAAVEAIVRSRETCDCRRTRASQWWTNQRTRVLPLERGLEV